MLKLIFALIAVAVAVPAGGLLAGVDRRLTARLQSRQGPPLLQPFYDVLKLFGKAPCVTNPWLIFSSYVCLMASAIALLMFFMQGDMLLLFFVMTVGAVFKVAGALSADSPYSNVGAQRELLQMLAYEPLVILTFVGMSAVTGTVNQRNKDVLKNLYDQMPEPKAVIAIGACACTGGVFQDCYNVVGGVDHVIPVDVYVPGCAAKPEAIIDGVVLALEVVKGKLGLRDMPQTTIFE